MSDGGAIRAHVRLSRLIPVQHAGAHDTSASPASRSPPSAPRPAAMSKSAQHHIPAQPTDRLKIRHLILCGSRDPVSSVRSWRQNDRRAVTDRRPPAMIISLTNTPRRAGRRVPCTGSSNRAAARSCWRPGRRPRRRACGSHPQATATSTRPSANGVACDPCAAPLSSPPTVGACRRLCRQLRAAAMLLPPVTRTRPSASSVIVCRERSSRMDATGVQRSVTGSNTSTARSVRSSGNCEPPLTSTRPSASRQAAWPKRLLANDPVGAKARVAGV